MIKLTQSRKDALEKSLPVLAKLGIELPQEVLNRLNGGEAFKMNRKEVKRFEKYLAKHGKAVVTIDGPRQKFSMMTLAGYQNRSKNGSKRLKAMHAKNGNGHNL